MVEIWLAFSVGLAGSGHCLGMCGGIVTALALSQRDSGAGRRFLLNLLYHAGRLCTYTLLGLIIGLVARAGLVGELKPAVKWLFLAANLFVTAIGIFTALGLRSLGISALDGYRWRGLTKLLSRLSESRSIPAAFPAGLLMGFLPCGLVYGLLISAATSGSAVNGGAMMLAFGVGTLPALLVFGQLASTLSALGRGVFERCMGGIVALLGALGVLKALGSMGYF